jgi:hypothetical protein
MQCKKCATARVAKSTPFDRRGEPMGCQAGPATLLR